jgi:pseudouridine kinase
VVRGKKLTRISAANVDRQERKIDFRKLVGKTQVPVQVTEPGKMTQSQKKIACIGGIDVDYKARLKARSCPGTSNPVTVTSCAGGVAGNIARNLARLGCEVAIFSGVGEDAAGDGLLRELRDEGLDTSGVRRSKTQRTAVYTAVLEPGGELFIGLADMEIFNELDESWADSIAEALSRFPIWVIDTNVPAGTLERLLAKHKKGNLAFVDPISVAKSARLKGLLGNIDVLFPNAKEAAVLSGMPATSRHEVADAAAEIRRQGTGAVIVTLGGEGIYIDDGKQNGFLDAIHPEAIRDVTGAGDAFVAGYVYGVLAEGGGEPAHFGIAAASLALETEESVTAELSAGRVFSVMKRNPMNWRKE